MLGKLPNFSSELLCLSELTSNLNTRVNKPTRNGHKHHQRFALLRSLQHTFRIIGIYFGKVDLRWLFFPFWQFIIWQWLIIVLQNTMCEIVLQPNADHAKLNLNMTVQELTIGHLTGLSGAEAGAMWTYRFL